MSVKFNRRYRLTVNIYPPQNVQALPINGQGLQEEPARSVVIEYPTTCAFSIKRGISGTPNQMDLRIYNLSATTRNEIFQDRMHYYDGQRGAAVNRQIKMEAGYGDNLFTVFQGNIFEAGSARQGADIITYVNATDGAYDTNLTQFFQTIAAPVTQKQLIETLAAQFPYLQIGAVADDGVVFNRPVSVSGNVFEALRTYGGKDIYVDLGKVYYLRDFEITEESDLLIDATTGLLETPNRQDSGLFLTTLFEPEAIIGRSVQLKSSILPIYDGRYKINAISHDCVMSGAVGGECRTSLGLIIQGQLYGREFSTVPYSNTSSAS